MAEDNCKIHYGKNKSKLVEEITKLSSPNKYIKDYTAPKEVLPDLVLIARDIFLECLILFTKNCSCERDY
jgi:hypothetical protein